jgi:hypothetical protein
MLSLSEGGYAKVESWLLANDSDLGLDCNTIEKNDLQRFLGSLLSRLSNRGTQFLGFFLIFTFFQVDLKFKRKSKIKLQKVFFCIFSCLLQK